MKNKITKENQFRIWLDQQTAGMKRNEKKEYRVQLSQKLSKSINTINNWYMGISEPNPLEKKSINIILNQEIYV